MAIPAAGNAWYAVCHYNKGKEGWSEKYWVQAASPAAVQTAIAPLILARLMLLPVAASLVYARFSQPKTPRDTNPLYPIDLSGAPLPWGTPGMANLLTTPPVVATVPKTEVCITVRLGTALGAWATQFVRCLPSSEFADDAIIPSLPDPVSAFVTPVTGNAVIATWAAAFVNYMAGLKTITSYASNRAALYSGPFSAGVLDFEAWSYAKVRQIGTKKTGRPFGQPVGRRILR